MNAFTTATTFCPTSLQLKFALAGRKPLLASVQARLPKFDRRSVKFVSVIVRNSAVNGNGLERRSPENSSWTNLSSAADDFSGWANGDGERQTEDPKAKQSLVGILMTGAAAIVLIAGITFASFSMSRRSNSRVEKQMEQLTIEQEKSPSIDEQNQVGEYKSGREDELLDNSTAESKTHADGDSLSIKENSEAVESRVNDDTGLRQSSEEDESSIPEDVRREPTIGGSLISPEAIDQPPISDINVDKHFDANALEPNNVSSSNQQSNLSRTPSFEPSISSTQSESNAIIETSIIQEDILKSGDVVSTMIAQQSGELLTMDARSKNIGEVSVDENVESSSGKKLNGIISPGAPLLPENSYQSGDQDLQNDQNDSVSQTIFDSTNLGSFFTSAGIPAPSLVSAALQSPPGKVLVPAAVDQLQSQAFSALQVLKVIEDGVQPGDLCTRREYARWLVQASSVLFRNTTSKVYPAMYIENVSELAFDDITPEDPDFQTIQGLAEAGLIASKLSRHDMQLYGDEDTTPLYFSPESPLSRQDLVCWRMALEKRQLPAVDKKISQQLTGFIDIDKINPDAWPAVVADTAAGEQGIITLAFGYTRLFQPEKPVTKAQAAIALSIGEASAIVGEELARIEAESMAENAVSAHSALVAQVEKDLNASFEKEHFLEREKINAVEKLAEEARREVEKLRAAREEENLSLMKERAAVDSELEVLSRLRREVEEQLQTLMTDKLEISYEKERINKLRIDVETENQEITRLQYELEVERKALSLARTWAEDEAKRAREQAKALDEARERWERQGIKVVVDDDLREEAEAVGTWIAAGKQFSLDESIEKSENLVDKLKKMAVEVRGKCKDTITKIIDVVLAFISNLKKKAAEVKDAAKARWHTCLEGAQHNTAEFRSAIKEGAKRVAEDWKEGVERLSQKFKA